MPTDDNHNETITIGSAPGVEVEVLPYGATLQRMSVTGGDGERRDVLVGVAGEHELRSSTAYFGSTVGRFANRIRDGRLEIDGQPVQLTVNDGAHHLHGGTDGFDSRHWTVVGHSRNSVELELTSPDGDQGYPGEVRAGASFSVTPEAVRLELTATTTATTVVNLTSHAYFDLDGHGVDEHTLQVFASAYTPVDAGGIPTGSIASVDGTALDLRGPRRVGDLARATHPQLLTARGIDHNFVIDGAGLRRAAVLRSERSRSALEVWTDQPGVQVYTGNFLDGSDVSRRGSMLRQGDGIALEPQLFPDSPNHPNFPSAVLRPGQMYRSVIEWRFSALHV
ncbi:aldose epimerase family protein [Rhodococcoides fascians]|uniref:aldose epimerase family protein n=1 Tax=Rhodococcoides fascians TaxID=1828 RepID=UPI00050C3BED|nr:aldose epimerase family protein [Rhodococcus fascians]